MTRNQSIVRAVFTASETKATHNAAQQPSASVGNDRQEKKATRGIFIETNDLPLNQLPRQDSNL
jgi:hypothetical protein